MVNNIKFTRILATTNISYVLSQMSDICLKLIKSKFPKDYFRSITVTTEDQAVREQRRLEENLPTEYQRANPALAIAPEYSIEDAITEPHDPWMHLATRQSNLRDLMGNYPTLFADIENDNFIFTLLKKHKINVKIGMRIESQQQTWDALSFIKNAFLIDSYFYILNQRFANIIPNVIISSIANTYGLDPMVIGEERNNFLNILEKNTKTDVVDIIDPAKKRAYYTFNFVQNILCRLSKPSADYSRKSQEVKKGLITFDLDMECSIPTNFVAQCKPPQDKYGELIQTTELDNYYPAIRINAYNIPPILELNSKKLIFFKGFLSDAPLTNGYAERILDEEELLLGIPDEFENGLMIPFTIHQNGENTEFSEEEEIDEDNPENIVKLQKIDTADGKWVIKAPVNFTDRKIPHFLSMLVRSNKEDLIFGIKIGAYPGIRFKITQPNVFQYFELDFPSFKKEDIIYLTLPEESNKESIVEIKEISIKRMLKKLFSTTAKDLIYLEEVIPEEIKNFIKYMLDNNYHIETYLEIQVLQEGGNNKLDPNNYEMDWEELKLTLINPLFNTTHYISFYADMKMYKDIQKKLDVSYHPLIKEDPIN